MKSQPTSAASLRSIPADRHRCVAYYAHNVKRKLFGIELPLNMAYIVRCEQRNSHCLVDGERDPDAIHDALNPDDPNAPRIEWRERVTKI